MNSTQMEMLSVKSAVERTLNGYAISHLNDTDVTPQQRVNNFFNDVERYVAMLFVSGQIDNNYLVRSTHQGIEIRFSTRGQYSSTTFILPEDLRWTVRKMIPRKTEVETIPYKEAWTDDYKDKVIMIDGPDPVIDTEPGYDFQTFEAAHNGREDPFGHLTAAEEDGLATVVIHNSKWTILTEEVGNIKS